MKARILVATGIACASLPSLQRKLQEVGAVPPTLHRWQAIVNATTDALESPRFETKPDSIAHRILHSQIYPPVPNDGEADNPFPNATLSDFRLTRLVNPKPQLGRQPVMYRKHAASPRYQCAGEDYNVFMRKATQMIHRKVQMQGLELWGRRPSLPPSAKNILIIGNSHTRQVALSFEYQYQEQLKSFHSKNSHTLVENFVFGNSTTTLYIVYNHPAVFSPRWKRNLEAFVLDKPLEEFDAIVLGTFNAYNPAHKSASLWVEADNYGKKHPGLHVDIHTYQPFNFSDLVQKYQGPIVSLASFDGSANAKYQANLQVALSQTNRTNLRVLNSRAPIAPIGGGECGHNPSSKTPLVATCHPTQGRAQHRCVGFQGGIPDFVAWDVLETLYEVLGEQDEKEESSSNKSAAAAVGESASDNAELASLR